MPYTRHTIFIIPDVCPTRVLYTSNDPHLIIKQDRPVYLDYLAFADLDKDKSSGYVQ